jgi:hypothetical protein
VRQLGGVHRACAPKVFTTFKYWPLATLTADPLQAGTLCGVKWSGWPRRGEAGPAAWEVTTPTVRRLLPATDCVSRDGQGARREERAMSRQRGPARGLRRTGRSALRGPASGSGIRARPPHAASNSFLALAMAPRTPTPVVQVNVKEGGKQSKTKLHNRCVPPPSFCGRDTRRADSLQGCSGHGCKAPRRRGVKPCGRGCGGAVGALGSRSARPLPTAHTELSCAFPGGTPTSRQLRV